MHRPGLAWRLLVPSCLAALAFSTSVEAQPAPSFRSNCQDLRVTVHQLDPKPDEYFVVEVVGTLQDVQSDGALAYMFMCSPPDLQVLCVTYSTNGRKKGETVILAGAYSQRGPDHVMLDPCLHHPPPKAG